MYVETIKAINWPLKLQVILIILQIPGIATSITICVAQRPGVFCTLSFKLITLYLTISPQHNYDCFEIPPKWTKGTNTGFFFYADTFSWCPQTKRANQKLITYISEKSFDPVIIFCPVDRLLPEQTIVQLCNRCWLAITITIISQ